MAIIKSGATTDELTVDATSKAARVTLYDTAGAIIDTNIPVGITVNSVTAAGNDIIDSFDSSTYKFLALQITGTFVATVTFQGSNDNGTWDSIVSQDMGVVDSPYTTTATTTGIFKIPTAFKYLRVRVTAFTSGTVTGIAFAYKEDSNTGQISATGTVDLATGSAVIGDIENLAKLGGAAISMDTGVRDTGTQRVTIATNDLVPVTGTVAIAPDPDTLLTDLYVGTVGAATANDRLFPGAGNASIQLLAIVFTNLAATPRYLKIYNDAVAPVAGVGVPEIICALASPGTLAYPLPSGGMLFDQGLGMTMTLKPDNNDTTGTATVDFSVTAIYKVN